MTGLLRRSLCHLRSGQSISRIFFLSGNILLLRRRDSIWYILRATQVMGFGTVVLLGIIVTWFAFAGHKRSSPINLRVVFWRTEVLLLFLRSRVVRSNRQIRLLVLNMF